MAHLAAIDKEGCINAVDRKTDRVKTSGEKVASREVEALTDRLPAVSEVAVDDLPDAKWGEAVTVIVVPKAGHALSEDEVVTHCSEQTARFKAPERVVFALVLPKHPSGKRQAAQAQAATALRLHRLRQRPLHMLSHQRARVLGRLRQRGAQR